MNTLPIGIPSNTSYAGFWLRFIAFIIDTILLQLFFSVFFLFDTFHTISKIPHHHKVITPEISFLDASSITIISFHFIIYWFYFAFMESSSWQATVGKCFLGLKVTDLQGSRISFGQATVRYFSKIISGIILCIGYIMIGFTERKQGLHDMIANTLVVRK